MSLSVYIVTATYHIVTVTACDSIVCEVTRGGELKRNELGNDSPVLLKEKSLLYSLRTCLYTFQYTVSL